MLIFVYIDNFSFSLKNIHKHNNGFSLIELVVVIAVLAILSAVAIPSFTRVMRKARQSAALAFVDSVLKTAIVFNSENGRWPNSWNEFAQNSSAINASDLESCSKYNARCSGNQTIILGGQYITEYYLRPDEIRISVWNPSPEYKNHHVWGCFNLNRGGNIYTWNTEKYFQGPAWGNENTRITGDNGERLSMCGQVGGVGE